MLKMNFLNKAIFLIFLTSLVTSCNFHHISSSKMDVTGAWQVTISISEGTINGMGALKQTDNKVSGWVGPSEKDPIPVAGTLEKDKLILMTMPQPGRTVAFDKVVLSIKADIMEGAIDQGSHGKGTIKFVRSK